MTTKFSQKKPRYDERPDHERIVITGMGAITPLGLDVESTWQRLINGESGIKAISHFDALTTAHKSPAQWMVLISACI